MGKRRIWTRRRILFILLLIVLTTGSYLAFRPGGPSIQEGSILTLDLRSPIPEVPPPTLGFGEARLCFRDVIGGLDQAATDDRIAALSLRLGGTSLGAARLSEFRPAIRRFQEAGKPVYAYAETVDMSDLMIGPWADRFYMAPAGLVLALGINAEVRFMRGALDKLGIEPEYVHTGQYKGSHEIYERTEMSEPLEQNLGEVLQDRYEQFLATACESRELDPESLRRTVDNPTLMPDSLQAIGLLDGLVYPDQIREELEEDLGQEPEFVSLQEYAGTSPLAGLDLKFLDEPSIALIYASGTIHQGPNTRSWQGVTTIGSDTIGQALRTAREDENVKAVVLRVDSPGGSGIASDIIWREMSLTAEVKPVIASMGSVAASGGYYIAMAADHILAPPEAIVGSIGVISGGFAARPFLEKLGLNYDQILIGRNANLFSLIDRMTDEQRAIMQSMSDHFYQVFLQKAAEGRNQEPEAMHQHAQGQIWTGRQALERGLIDQLGGLEDALRIARDRAGLGADADVKIKVLPKPEGLKQLLEQLPMARSESPLDSLAQELEPWLRLAELSSSEPVLALDPLLMLNPELTR